MFCARFFILPVRPVNEKPESMKESPRHCQMALFYSSTGGTGMSAVSEFIKTQTTDPSKLSTLPLLHSCDGYSTRNIINDKELKTTECPVFKEELLYFFYGKPAYPVSEKVAGNRTDIEYLPVCFIVPSDKVMPYRVFPFDTGAFAGKLYSKHLHHKMKIDDFELENTIEETKRYIEVFFEDNDGYLAGQPSSVRNTDDPYVEGLISIHNITGEEEIDERANTVEVIANRNVSIEGNVECIIMPDALKKSRKVQNYLDKHKEIECRTYVARRLTAPGRYNEVVFQKAMDYLKEKGYIK